MKIIRHLSEDDIILINHIDSKKHIIIIKMDSGKWYIITKEDFMSEVYQARVLNTSFTNANSLCMDFPTIQDAINSLGVVEAHAFTSWKETAQFLAKVL